jgi:hypothetical protein
MNELVNELSKYFPAARRVGEIFARIETAEEEITRAMEMHPEHKDLLWKSFSRLSGEREVVDERLYRYIYRELLERVLTGESFDLLTKPEMLTVLHKASLVSPMRRPASNLFERLFSELYREITPQVVEDLNIHFSESEVWEMDELEKDLKQVRFDA